MHPGFVFIPCHGMTPRGLRAQYLIPNLSLSVNAYPSIRPFRSGHVTTQSREISANSPLAERKQIADRKLFCRILKKPSFPGRIFSQSWAHKPDSKLYQILVLTLWKAPEVGEAEEGHDRRRRGGGGPPPALLGAGRDVRLGEGDRDLQPGEEEGVRPATEAAAAAACSAEEGAAGLRLWSEATEEVGAMEEAVGRSTPRSRDQEGVEVTSARRRLAPAP
jgi:hypothetical protein